MHKGVILHCPKRMHYTGLYTIFIIQSAKVKHLQTEIQPTSDAASYPLTDRPFE